MSVPGKMCQTPFRSLISQCSDFFLILSAVFLDPPEAVCSPEFKPMQPTKYSGGEQILYCFWKWFVAMNCIQMCINIKGRWWVQLHTKHLRSFVCKEKYFFLFLLFSSDVLRFIGLWHVNQLRSIEVCKCNINELQKRVLQGSVYPAWLFFSLRYFHTPFHALHLLSLFSQQFMSSFFPPPQF